MDRKCTSAVSVKRKFYQWLLKMYQEDSFAENAQSNPAVPDVTDIAGLLRSSGFRLRSVDIGKQPAPGDSFVSCAGGSGSGSGSGGAALGCEVTVKCAKSGLSVTLQSESACRCPPAACDDSASVWSVTSLSGSQESLNKVEMAGSSALPSVPAAVAEVAGAATRCVMRLLDEAAATPPPPPPPPPTRPRPVPVPRPPGRTASVGNLSSISSISAASDNARRFSEEFTFTYGFRAPSPLTLFQRSLDSEQWIEKTFDLGEVFPDPSSTDAEKNEDSAKPMDATFKKDELGKKEQLIKNSPDEKTMPLTDTLKSEGKDVVSKTEEAIENMSAVLEYIKKLLGSEGKNPSSKLKPSTGKKQIPKSISAPHLPSKTEKKPLPASSKTIRTPRLASVLAEGRPSDPGPVTSRHLSNFSKTQSTPPGVARTGARGTLHNAAAALRRRLAVARVRGRGEGETTSGASGAATGLRTAKVTIQPMKK